MLLMETIQKLYPILLSDRAKRKAEKGILYIALFGFAVHLLLIYLSKFGWIGPFSDTTLFNNPISAIYTPFSFILIYEVYLLIYYLPRSFTTYITKQYEIITLIIIRKLFKDLAAIELSSDWFEIKGDLQFTYDIIAAIVLLYLIYQFQKQGKRRFSRANDQIQIDRFILRKKMIALCLVPLFFIMAMITLGGWLMDVSAGTHAIQGLETINNLFFDEFFAVLILVDVVLLLISFFYTDKFHKIIRNSGFDVSTILIRLSFGVSGLVSTILVVAAVLFGLAIILVHNLYEKNNVMESLTEV